MKLLVDQYNREVNYLRLSVTDRCNLRCRYCRPEEGIELLPQREILTFEEILRVVKVFASQGIRKVRLTGGEPLVRRGIVELVRDIVATQGVMDVSLTTNGVLLAEYARPLKEAGLRRINVSLDSLRPERFAHITRRDRFGQVWEGIEEALRVGFAPVKLNVVALRGFNDDEIEDFARLSLQYPLHIRFIEFMPVGENNWRKEDVLSCDEIKGRVEATFGELVPLPRGDMDGPARRFRIRGSKGEVGFISPLTAHFCSSCNRLRVTADGKIRTCLFSDDEMDLKGLLRSGASDDALAGALREALARKPEGPCRDGFRMRKCQRGMATIGG